MTGAHAASIRVQTPNGGNTWRRGKTVKITWSSTDVPGKVKIELLRQGTHLRTIASAVGNTGTRSYQVSRALPATCRATVRICALDQPGVCDTSDTDFCIE